MAYKIARSIDLEKKGRKSADSRTSPDKSRLAEGRPPRDPAETVDSIARLSHDIRTQLYIIIGFAELMLDEVPGKLNEEQRRNLNDVLNSGRRLETLLNDIVLPPQARSGGAGENRAEKGTG